MNNNILFTQLKFHTLDCGFVGKKQRYLFHLCIAIIDTNYLKSENILCPQVLALRVSFVGEMGWELHTPNESCVPVYHALLEAGKDKGLLNAGYRAIDSLSIEKGYPHWHAEIK